MAVALVAVVEVTPSARVTLGRPDLQVLVDERIGGVAEEPAGDAGDVGDLARVKPLVPRSDNLTFIGNRGEQANDFACGTAVTHDQFQPVAWLGPVAFATEDFRVLAEVIGIQSDHNEPRAESIGKLSQRKIIMLGAISRCARIQERDLGPDLGMKALPKPLGRRLVVVDQVSLHERVAQNEAADRAFMSGSAPRQPQELVD